MLRRHYRLAVRALIAPALLLGTLATATPAPTNLAAVPVAATRSAAQHPASGPGSQSPLALAQERARDTGRPVTVAPMTTPTSVTTANPDGSLTRTQTTVPVRTMRHGTWVPLNPALHRTGSGKVVPAATASPLVLSGGGSGPFAVLDEAGYMLSLTWPAPLPAPTVSGATTTYPDVLPGVDLTVTADDQGGVSTVLIVKNATAASNPALGSLKFTASGPGLTLGADAAGNLTATATTAGPDADPVFTGSAPLAWDSTPVPPGIDVVNEPDGSTVVTGSGDPTASSITEPGAAAQVTSIPLTVNGNTVTMSPPAAALTGPGVTYPVYVDPTIDPNPVGAEATHWTHVDSGFPGTSYWDKSGDLQVGKCYDSPPGACNGLGVARTFFRMPVSPDVFGASIIYSRVFMTDKWAPSCTPEPLQLYTTGPIRQSTTWNNQPSWGANPVQQQSFAFGFSQSCGYSKNDVTWDTTSTIQHDADIKAAYQTFGLRAPDESDANQWKQFRSGSGYITMTTRYDLPPAKPDRSTSPGGNCSYGAAGAPTIGLDDVTFYATAFDADGDNHLTTEFIILNAAGSIVYDSNTEGTSVKTGDNQTASLKISHMQMASFNSGQATYRWYALVSDSASNTSPKPTDYCYFIYNPNGPPAPTFSLPPSGTLGQNITATFGTPGCSPTGNSPCPVSYTYQEGTAPPVTLTAAVGGAATTASIPVTQLGPIQLTIYSTAAGGNLSEAATPILDGEPPATPYADGYYLDGNHPDVLLTGTGSTPSLWLYPGNGDGTVRAPLDIGSLGTTIHPANTTDGPGDWNGAQILHGSLTSPSDGVQDVIAYYPATGSGAIVSGTGDAAPLIPSSPGLLEPGLLANNTNNSGNTPIQLAAAGYASEQNTTGADDLIGIAANGVGYELDLYTNSGCASCYQWGSFNPTIPATLSTTAPDPADSNWHDYTLVTATRSTATANATFTSDTVLFALDTTNGAVWESANPTSSTTALIGMDGTWTKITGLPWGSSPPSLVQADVNQEGNLELWTLNHAGTTLTAYTLSGTALTQEAPGSPTARPAHDWPLTDGSPFTQTTSATSASDTIGGNTATITGTGYAWPTDSYFSTDIVLYGNATYLTAPAGTIPTSDATPAVNLWFKTTDDRVLVSLQNQAFSPDSTTTGQYDPVMYVGTDGKLYAEWWTGALNPIVSKVTVDDGVWHHAVLDSTAGSNPMETLYVDGQVQGTLSGAVKLSGLTNLCFGGGYIGGNWPSESHFQQNGATGYPNYFHGRIADITLHQ